MPKNKGKGGKNRRRGKNENEGEKRELIFKEDGQEYAQVVKMLGNGRLEAQCFDGEKRLAHIRGKMRKKVWINQGDIILISLRDYQDEKADVILKYNADEARNLKAYGELPETAKINETDTFAPEDDDVEFDFDIDETLLPHFLPLNNMASIFPLACSTQSYDWGKLGSESKVAEFALATKTPINPTKPYAELWMGTHPNGPSRIYSSNDSTPLKDLITQQPALVSEQIAKAYEGDLPFLFKVLSIRKALSIQAHPDKTLGKELFEKRPDLYKDPNHKPEMAIAITPFEALCGFRPLEEIVAHVETYPEISDVVGQDNAQQFADAIGQDVEKNKAALKQLFTALMSAPQEQVSKSLSALVARIKSQGPGTATGSVDELVVRLDSQYPGGDIGVFAVMLLNYVHLMPGQAIFLGANEPHAYLSGDCVECMAASDNVVRAGLTPKFKDVAVLTSMLTYRYGSADSQIMSGTAYPNTQHSILYDPPIDEFSVILTRLKAGEEERFAGIHGPSIFIVTEGEGQVVGGVGKREGGGQLVPGGVWFVGAGEGLTLTAGKSGLVVYRAFAVPV